MLILGIQEMRNTTEEPFKSQGYRIYNGRSGQGIMKQCPQFGTRFMVNVKIIKTIIDFQAISPRITTLTLKTTNKTFLFMGDYYTPIPLQIRKILGSSQADTKPNKYKQC